MEFQSLPLLIIVISCDGTNKWFNVQAFLKDRLVVERGVGGSDEVRESVVLAEPDGVHRLQAGVLVGAVVARQELILKEE